MDALLVGAWEIIALAVSVATKKSSAACAVSFLALPAPVFYLQLASDGFGHVVCNSVALPACGQCEMGYDCNLLLSCPHRQHDYVFLEAE